MVSVISTLILDVSHAVEVLVFMFAGGVRCHTSVVFLNTVVVVACVVCIPDFNKYVLLCNCSEYYDAHDMTPCARGTYEVYMLELKAVAYFPSSCSRSIHASPNESPIDAHHIIVSCSLFVVQQERVTHRSVAVRVILHTAVWQR